MSGGVHVVGVAGVGMSALAQALMWGGGRVSGSDRFLDQGRDLPIFGVLRAAGVELVAQDGSGVGADTRMVVYSTAIEEDNPDFQAARRRGIPLRHRADVLAELARGNRVLAVAGTAGKTTTTGMAGWVLEQLGADPTVINGGALVDWADGARVGNVRRGADGAPWVVEVDESDRSLLRFHPEWSVLTNISQDHFSLAEVEELFRQYAAQVQTGLVCGPGVARVLGALAARVVEVADEPVLTERGYAVSWRGLSLRVPTPGAHNARNALLAAELCAQMGYAPEKIAEALSRFGGIQRRLERVDCGGSIRVVDDYAHNPAKIEAAWEAVATPTNRVLAVWRPHGYGPLRSMMDGLEEAFARACRRQDRLWLLPVFDAGGTANRTVGSHDLAEKLRARDVPVALVEDFAALGAEMKAAARAGDTILIMGARDPQLPAFARAMISD